MQDRALTFWRAACVILSVAVCFSLALLSTGDVHQPIVGLLLAAAHRPPGVYIGARGQVVLLPR